MSLLLANARLVGADSAEPTGVLLKHGVVTAIGADVTGSATVDLGGRWLMPGLREGHAHLTQAALMSRRVDVSRAGSAAEAARLIAEAPVPIGAEIIVGFGFRDGLWPDEPTARTLDAVIESVPVVVISGDIHCCWLNSAAMRLFGVVGDGIVREGDAFPITAAISDIPTDVLDGWVMETTADAARRGVVGIVELEMADNIGDWTRRFAAGFDSVRIEAGVYADRLPDAIRAGHRTGTAIEGTSGLLTVGPFKVITDGSLNTRTAFCADPYPGLSGPQAHGVLTVPPERLVELLTVASDGGFSAAVHAIGDEANRLALDAFERVGVGGRIEHAQLVAVEDFPRFADLGVAASVQPEHAMDDRDVADHHWHGRTDRAFALRSLLDAGAELVLGSDAPVAPLDPWVTIAAAVARSRDGREPWHPEQSITVAEALAASTGGRSRVREGDVCDVAVLDADPMAADPESLRTMPVAATFLGGYATYSTL